LRMAAQPYAIVPAKHTGVVQSHGLRARARTRSETRHPWVSCRPVRAPRERVSGPIGRVPLLKVSKRVPDGVNDRPGVREGYLGVWFAEVDVQRVREREFVLLSRQAERERLRSARRTDA
jgi:hypothetical protein